jgi:hypothetical protein
MTSINRALLCVFALGAMCVAPSFASAQQSSSQRGQPKTPFGTADLAKLRWLEGSWAATAPNETPFYARYHIPNDSTIDVTYYRDSSFTQPSGSGRIYLTVGRVYQTFGSGRWGATNIDSTGAYFIPQVNAHNTFAWAYQSPDAWTLTQRTGVTGHERVTVYHLKRLKG